MRHLTKVQLTEADWNKIREIAWKAVGKGPGSHGWDHVRRVYELCLKIGRKEKADLTVLGLAALLHDIGRQEEKASKGKVCHARVGARKAAEILAPLKLSPDTLRAVIHCIRSHRFRGNHPPDSPEARILFDADKLDSLGAVGVGRAFLFAGEVGARLHNAHKDLSLTVSYSWEDTAFREFQVKLKKVQDRMQTRTGKALAESRHRFMVRFFARLDQEVKALK